MQNEMESEKERITAKGRKKKMRESKKGWNKECNNAKSDQNKREKKAMGLSLWKELFYGAIHLFEYAAYKSTEIHTYSDGKTKEDKQKDLWVEKQSNCAQLRHFIWVLRTIFRILANKQTNKQKRMKEKEHNNDKTNAADGVCLDWTYVQDWMFSHPSTSVRHVLQMESSKQVLHFNVLLWKLIFLPLEPFVIPLLFFFK